MTQESCCILPLEDNRVKRFYKGGSGLNKWRNEIDQGDSFYSEDMILTTVQYIGDGYVKDEGYSHVLYNGKSKRLKTLVDNDRKGFLGPAYADDPRITLGLGCRIGDSSDSRLVIQYHPTNSFAQNHLNIPFGKTEAWYIAATRDKESFCYVGFKKGVSKEDFVKAFFAGDSDHITSMMHKISIKEGNVILVPSGIIHAMGPGVTFVEFHNPCDYTFRLEKSIAGIELKDEELHHGLGYELLLSGLDYSTYSREEAERVFICRERPLSLGLNIKRTTLISFEDTPAFRVEKIIVTGKGHVRNYDSHLLLIATKGDIVVQTGESKVHLTQGRGAFVPYEASHEIEFTGNNCELLAGFPFEVNK